MMLRVCMCLCLHNEVSVMSPRLATTVESCTAAAVSTDARDKYFISYVGEGSPMRASSRQWGVCLSTVVVFEE